MPGAPSRRPQRHGRNQHHCSRVAGPKMALPLDFMASVLVTLFVVVDPIGLVPTFLAITGGLPRTARRQVAVRAALIAFAILTGSALIRRLAAADDVDLASRLPDRGRPAAVFHRVRDGVRPAHDAS